MSSPQDLSALLRSRRESPGLSPAQVARRAGTSVTALCRCEKGWARFEISTLRVGHRFSDGFDFFRTDGMDRRGLHDALSVVGEIETLQQGEKTFGVLLSGVKLSFFQVGDPFLILQSGPALQEYLDLLPRKYGTGRTNASQVLMSLTYFDDRE